MRDVWCQGLLEGLYQGFLWQVCLEMLTCWKGDTSSSKIEAMDLTFTWQSRLTWEVWKSECFHLQILRTRQRVQCLNRKFGGLLFLAHGFAHLFRYVRPLSCQQKGQHPLGKLELGSHSCWTTLWKWLSHEISTMIRKMVVSFGWYP